VTKGFSTNFLIKNLLILKARLFFRPEVIPFSETFNKAKRILILLPTKVESFAIALNHLSSFSSFFTDSQKFLLLPFDGEGFLCHLKNFEILKLRKSHLNWLSLPNKRLIRKLKELRFDFAVDLDLEKNLFNAYLSFLSGSPLRIGIKNGVGLPFYNFEISLTKNQRYLDELYLSFIKTLVQFKNLSKR